MFIIYGGSGVDGDPQILMGLVPSGVSVFPLPVDLSVWLGHLVEWIYLYLLQQLVVLHLSMLTESLVDEKRMHKKV